jgi:hypothetical protein
MSRETTVWTPRSAVRFLAWRVEEQAQREQVPLSQPERKMLLFSEVEEPETAAGITEAFGEQEDDKYETKVSGLLKRAHDYDCEHGQEQAWDDALTALRGADYYILVMASQAGIRPSQAGIRPSQAGIRSPRPPGDTLKLLLTAIAVVIIALPLGFLMMTYGPGAWKRFEHRFLPNEFAHWVFFVLCVAAVWRLGKLIEKTDLVGKLVKRFGSKARAGE